MSLHLHPEHGVNPTLGVCFICGQADGTIGLLGFNKGNKAPNRAVVSREPCHACKDVMKTSVIFIEVKQGASRADCAPPRTGRYAAVKDEGVEQLRGAVKPELVDQILKMRACFLDEGTWEMIGLNKIKPQEGRRKVLGNFDFRRAWEEVAMPAYKQLSDDVIWLINLVKAHASNLSQLKDTSMPWPETYPLKEAFQKLPSRDLAEASYVLWSYGHWAFDARGEWSQRAGLYWKFSLYADQVLRERCGMERMLAGGWGVEFGELVVFTVLNGLLRATYNTPHEFRGVEVALATPEDLGRCMAWGQDEHWLGVAADGDAFARWAEDMAQVMWPKNGLVKDFYKIGERIREERWVSEKGDDRC